MVYFTSDLHFGHVGLALQLRHMTIDVHDELIIKNWNAIVNKKDKVFILGDITMEKPKLVAHYLNQLHGVKEVILGNHDIQSARELLDAGIKVNGGYDYKGFWLSHMPCHPSQLEFYRGNLHGHIHVPGILEDGYDYHPVQDLGPNYLNVNVEFHNYFPWSMDEIEEHFKQIRHEYN